MPMIHCAPQDLKVVNSYLKSCFLIFPNYNLGHGLMEMAYNEYINEYYAKIGEAGRQHRGWTWGRWGLQGPWGGVGMGRGWSRTWGGGGDSMYLWVRKTQGVMLGPRDWVI